jgi:hypothetical protein
MNWLFRPSVLILVSLALVIGAVALVVPPLWEEGKGHHPTPLPVAGNEAEIVWLYSATNAATWERFVTAVGKAAAQVKAAHPDLAIQIDDATFPRQTAAVPQLTLSLGGRAKRLVFRWYKLTRDGTGPQWVEALLRRRPAPLAIISGNSSDQAIELATSLRDQSAKNPNVVPPLLLLTSATADRVQPDDVPLTSIYDKRTFRFCFTNRQMAQSVTDFIWSRDELRPDADPFYVALWRDDAYSSDLTGRFCEVLRHPLAARSAAQELGLVGGCAATGALPIDLLGLSNGQFADPVSEFIDYSVGLYDQPNRREVPVVRRMIDVESSQYPGQRRPLLVLPAGSSQVARRFLHGLFSVSTREARHFVVATGDGISFNTIYRDRNLAWPIQDLPFNLIFFCHRNPVDADAGFVPEGTGASASPDQGSPTTGTEDLLLNMDIVEAITRAAYQSWPADATQLAAGLANARWDEGRISFDAQGTPLFDVQGNRTSGTGEHIVWLRPTLRRDRDEAQAYIEIWTPGRAKPYRVLAVNYDDTGTER